MFQDLINETSGQLYALTDNRAWIRDVEVVLPSSWRVAAFQPGRQVVSSGHVTGAAELLVTETHAALGSSPWTLQTTGCGKRGDRINLPIGFLDFNQTSSGLAAKGEFLYTSSSLLLKQSGYFVLFISSSSYTPHRADP